MSLQPPKVQTSVRLGEDFELDFGAYKLRRSGRALKLERLPMEVLLLLVEQPGELVTREQIVERIWGKNVFLDTDNSINGAIRKIRQALRDDPEQPQFIQTVTGKGYRFIALVSSHDQVNPQASVTPEALPPPVEVKRFAIRGWQAAISLSLTLIVVLVAAAAAYRLWLRPSAQPSSSHGKLMLAVLPFENLTGDPAQEYVSDGLTEEMITELGRLNHEHLGVIARTSVMFYKQNPKPLDQIGRDLGVQYVLEGSVRRDPSRVRVTAQLIQVKDQTHLWARNYDRPAGDVLALQQEITQEIADEVELALGEPRAPNAGVHNIAASTTSSEAYDLYLKGRYFWNRRTPQGFQQAADYFQQAIAKDPNYARAYAGIADTFALMSTWNAVPQNEFMPRARTAALKALALDETLAEAHASLALIAENYDYDWQTAEKEFRRAIQLDPDYATAHQWYAEYLSWQGRVNEALAESERARQLDPLSLIIATDHGAIFYCARQYDRAIAQFRAVLDMDPNFSRAHGGLIDAYEQAGRAAEAEGEVDRFAPNDSPWYWAQRVNLYGRSGRTADARRGLAKLEHLVRRQPQLATPTLLLAYVGTGQNDLAIGLLQKAYAEHSNVVTTLKVDPNYDGLRTDPRFQELLRRLAFPE
ncbi:MAG TPA: winged helix-turn-helix domain-containing protein [Candidatus Sulfotelmatobacter sp.]|jgi:TolB-like protein/DNA-binding winged helix-turn-helix (wHTH) protein/Tfp pilus assembly protein PilF